MKAKISSCIKRMQQKLKGSILAYSLIVLAMMFTIVGSMSVVTVLDKNSASTTQSSAQSFQIADSAVQIAIKDVQSNPGGSLKDVFTDLKGRACKDSDGTAKVSGNLGTNMNFEIVFKKSDGTSSGEELITSCNEALANVKSIKSIGSYKDTTARAVEVAVAATTSFPSPGCYITGMANDDSCVAAGVPTTYSEGWGTKTCADASFNARFHKGVNSGARLCMWLCCK